MSALTFDETMRGYLAGGHADPVSGYHAARRARTKATFAMHVRIDDVDAFLADRTAQLSGEVRADALGGRLTIESGTLTLHEPHPDARHLRMRYELLARDDEGRAVTLHGFKQLQDDPMYDVWTDTTRLYVVAYGAGEPIAAGMLKLSRLGFLRQQLSTRAHADGVLERLVARAKFSRFFAGGLLRVYLPAAQPPRASPSFPVPPRPAREWEPLRNGLRRRTLEVEAGDGAPLTIHHIRGESAPTRGPVYLSHGSGTRADIFFGAPRSGTFAEALVAAGFDVWAGNWRASIDLPARQWTLDEAAAYDHPAFIRTIREQTGAERVKAVVHCQGATSFALAAVAGLVPAVDTIVSNAVTLHPDVPWASRLRQIVLVPAARHVLPGLDSQCVDRPPSAIAAGFSLAARLARGRDCDSPVCQYTNYSYGVGRDVLWHHALLDRDTHDWLDREWGFVPVSFFEQMRRSVLAGHIVPVSGLDALPASPVAEQPLTDARWVLVAGTDNRTFLHRSQERTHAWLEAHQPGRHELHLFPGYGHLDVWFGRDAHRDVHPLLVDALLRDGG